MMQPKMLALEAVDIVYTLPCIQVRLFEAIGYGGTLRIVRCDDTHIFTLIIVLDKLVDGGNLVLVLSR
jgi:hypothetical protein